MNAAGYFLFLAGSGCAGAEGNYLFWAGRSYEKSATPSRAFEPWRRIAERFPEQRDPMTGQRYCAMALARGLVLAGELGKPDEIRSLIEANGRFIDEGKLTFFDDEGRELASVDAGALADYCLARALARNGDMVSAGKLLKGAEYSPADTLLEKGEVRSLGEAWSELKSVLDESP